MDNGSGSNVSEESEEWPILVGSARIRYGVHAHLEDAANKLIFDSLRLITSRKEKSDILTTWKEKNRIGHEVYTASGFPDTSVRSGMFHRVLNRSRPHLNSRDGLAQATPRQEHTIAMTHYNGTGGASDA